MSSTGFWEAVRGVQYGGGSSGDGGGAVNGGKPIELKGVDGATSNVAKVDLANPFLAKLSDFFLGAVNGQNANSSRSSADIPAAAARAERQMREAPSGPQTLERAQSAYEKASDTYEQRASALNKLLAETGDYAGYGADLERAKTSAADAKAKMEEAADAYRAMGGTIDRDANERVGKTIAGGAEQYLASLLGTAGSYYEGGTRGSKAQIERDLADMAGQEEKAQKAYDEALAKYNGDTENVNVQAAARALKEVQDNRQLYQGMLENTSLEETAGKIYGASDRMGERGAQRIAEAKEGLGAGGQFLVDTGAAGVQLLGDIALGTATGLGMMPVMGARSYGGGANEARQAGGTYEQQVATGAATAAVEMLTEKLADGLAGVAGKGAADDAAKEIIRKWAKTDAGRTALRALYGISGEASEEAISTLVSPLVKRIYDSDALREGYGTAEGRKELINEALHDALVGGALGGFGTLGSLGTGQNAAELADMRMRDASMGDVGSQVNNAFDVLSGRMTPEQSQAREAAAMQALGMNQQAPAPAPVTGQDALLEAAGIQPAELEVQNNSTQQNIDNAVNALYNGINENVINEGVNTDVSSGGPSTDSVGVPGVYGGRDADNQGQRGLDGAPVNSGLGLLSEDTISKLQQSGVYAGMQDSSANNVAFSAALDEARAADTANGWAVTPKSAEELNAAGTKTYMDANGTAGFAVASDGDIEAVFANKTKGAPKGVSRSTIPQAIAAGGVKLDCYGAALARLYSKHGFVPVARVTFNPEYANDGWDASKGAPDIYFMMYTGGDANSAVANYGTYPILTQEQLDALPLMEYDDAYSYRDSLLAQSSGQGESQEAGAPPPPPAGGPTTAESTNGTGPERERGGSANIRTNENAEADLRQSFEESPETYRQLTNAETQAKADEILAKGFDAARSEVEQAIGKAKAGYKLSPEHLVAGFEVANELTRRGETEAANRLMADIFAEQTAAGQLGQLGRLLRQSSPAVKSMTVENIVNKLNEKLTKGQLRKNMKRGQGDAEGKISVDQSLIDAFTNAETDEASNEALDAIKQNIADQIPATFRDKFTALRYLNMLGNLKTQGRNLIGNTAMMAATNVKYTVQAVNELVASAVSGGRYERNTALGTSAQLRQQAAEDFDANRDDIKGESKYADVAKQATRDIEEKRKIFDFKPLEAYRKATNWAMDAGDVIFMKSVYTRSFAGWMQAHNVTDVNNATPEQIAKARAFATKEAQEATFHDSNAVSDWVSGLGRGENTPDVIKAVSEGVMPFRKTPANVGVRAVEYSPVGVAETIYKGIQAAKGKGDTTAADVINSLSKNVTGSALLVAGYFLAAAGMARGSNDDDKELSNFQKMQGAMDYSVKIGDRNVSLSQFAPMAIPFFMGVKLNELFDRSDEALSLDDAKDILGIVTDPMLEMSMLSGVNDFLGDLSSMNGDTDAIPSLVANAAISYLSQGLTNTLLGQFEQASEENRQTTYTDTKSEEATDFDKRLGSGLQRKLAQYAAKTPGIDYNQQDYVDAWGRTISNGGAAERYFNALLNPTYTSKENSTEVDAELERLYTDNKDVEGFPDVLPSKRPRSAAIGDGIVMTPDEYLQFSKDSGAKKLEFVKDFMGSEQYKGLTDQQRADIISNLYALADNMSLDKVKENYKVNRPTDWDKVKALEDPVEYLTGKEILRQSGNDFKGTPDYTQIDSLLAGWGNLSADTQAELSKMANVNNMRFAYDQLGVGSGDYFDVKNTVAEAEKSQLGNKTGGAADAIVIAKTGGKTDEEKLAALEALNQPDKQTGKRQAVVRRFEAAAQYNIPFDQWAAFEAAVYDNAKNPASPSNQAIYAAEDATGIKRGTGKAIWRKISGDENKVEMYDDYFSQYYEAPDKVSFSNYLASAAGLG